MKDLPGWSQKFFRESRQQLKGYLTRQFPVSTALLFILLLGFLAGLGLFVQNLSLQGKLARLEAENARLTDLQSLKMTNAWLKNRVAVLQEEKAALLDDVVEDLSAKTRIIESILDSVGVDIQVQESKENSGGPFTSFSLETPENLIVKTDRYLQTIQNLPLGAPVPGVITSRFGSRTDPLNGKKAYHRGVDIRGSMGSDITATADGIVLIQNYDQLNGRYIILDHGNGFRTKYGHLKKSLVKKGDSVQRGQVIGLVGSSGRSTGPHVHYEIRYNNKIVNPTRFMRIARYLNKKNSAK